MLIISPLAGTPLFHVPAEVQGPGVVAVVVFALPEERKHKKKNDI